MKFIHLLPVLQELTPDDFGYDYTQKVPVLSIIAMVIGIIAAIAVPIALFLYLKKRFRLDPQAAFFGLLSYMLGGFLLSNLIIILIQWINMQTGIFNSVPALYYALASLISVSLEVLSMYFGLKFLHRKGSVSLGNTLLFSLVFILIPLMTQTVSMLGNFISISITVNQGGLYEAVANMIESGSSEEDILSLLEAMTALFHQNFMYYLLMAFDVLLLIPIQAGICAILSDFIQGRIPKAGGRFALLPAAAYALAMFLRFMGLVNIIAVAELIYLAVGIFSVWLAWRLLKEFQPDDLKRLTGKPDPSVNKKDTKPEHKMPKIVMPKN